MIESAFVGGVRGVNTHALKEGLETALWARSGTTGETLLLLIDIAREAGRTPMTKSASMRSPQRN